MSTSANSKKPTTSASELGVTPQEFARLTRPFDKAILLKARMLASLYRLVIERDPDSDSYFGCSLEMPSVMGGGPDVGSCVVDTLEATVAAIASMLERNETPPSPAREGKRDQQVNIRLTAEERLTLETAATRAGFRSVSDYVRSAALGGR